MESPKIENWLSRVSTGTARLYRYQFNGFMKWVEENGGAFRAYSPDELIEYQQEADNSSKYDVLDLIQNYMLSQKDKRYKTLKGRYAALRSFFQHNRAELPRDPSFRLKGDLPPVEKLLTVENVRDMCLAMNPTYRAIVLCMLQGGMGLSEFEAWNLTGWESLKAQLRKDPKFIRIDIAGRKRMRNIRPYYTLIGSDAIDALRVYLERRPANTEAIFVTQFGTPVKANSVSWIWLEKAKRIGIVRPQDDGHRTRYGKNIHLLRSLFRTQWEKSPAKGSVAEFLMGHVVDKLEYNKAFNDDAWTRKEYRSALPMLQIMSSARPFGKVDLEEVDRLDDEVDRLRSELNAANRRLESVAPIGEEVARLLNDPILVEALKAIAERGRVREI